MSQEKENDKLIKYEDEHDFVLNGKSASISNSVTRVDGHVEGSYKMFHGNINEYFIEYKDEHHFVLTARQLR